MGSLGADGAVHLLVRNMGVSAHRREIGVAEILSDQARVTCGLPKPGRSRMAQRVRRDVLAQSSRLDAAIDQAAERRGGELAALKAAEHEIIG